jgi:hypothetical protein
MADKVGIDCALDCTKLGKAINKAGADVIGRYYRWPTSKLAPLTFGEAAALSAAGLSIVALWEWASDQIGNFSRHEGVDQGSSAYKQALNAHQPSGTPIYFAVDSDFSNTEITGPINDYFGGVNEAFNAMGKGQSNYLIGAYGSGLSCSWLLSHGAVVRTWLAVSPKWQGYDFQGWDIKQSANDLKIPGLKPGVNGDYDTDAMKPTFGGFQINS